MLSANVQVGQADPDIELPRQNRVPDRSAPQHTGVCCIRIEVGQFADRPSGLGQCGVVMQVCERDRGGAHKRAVARRLAPLVMQRSRFRVRFER